MFYYRYRPISELSMKELMYNEIYFASTHECNDPYEGEPFYVFEPDMDKWHRLIKVSWSQIEIEIPSEWSEELAKIITQEPALTFSEAFQFNYIGALSSILKSPPSISIVEVLASLIKQYLKLYKPRDSYYACFSKTNDNILMWSHYASIHKGYCLVFKPIENALNQCPQQQKTGMSRKTEKGIAPQMSYAFPSNFHFQDLEYTAVASVGDAFMLFPQYVANCTLNEEERIDLMNSQQKQYLEKHSCWNYEEEVRIMLTTPAPWLFGEEFTLTQHEKLFHFDATQLVGIIFGAKMEKNTKSRILEIVAERMDKLAIFPSDQQRTIFDFVVFESNLSTNSRTIDIEPTQIFSLTNIISKGENDFNEKFNAWEEGWAIKFNGNGGASKVQVD